MTAFQTFGLSAPLISAVQEHGYSSPFPIQAAAIPILRAGHDLVACAETGSGKTAAYGLSMIDSLLRLPPSEPLLPVKMLVLVPTRELCIQSADELSRFASGTALTVGAVFGGIAGVSKEQLANFNIIVATPGRLAELCGKGDLSLTNCKFVVLDEFDKLLSQPAFREDLKKIRGKLPLERQACFFSATFPEEVAREIELWTTDYQRVAVNPDRPVKRIDHYVMKAGADGKLLVLCGILENNDWQNRLSLIFANSKDTATFLSARLNRLGFRSMSITGDVVQEERIVRFDMFRENQVPIIVASDVFQRGIDLPHVDLVINYDLPKTPDDYCHRVGRSGRAGASGRAITICSAAEVAGFSSMAHVLKISTVAQMPPLCKLLTAAQRRLLSLPLKEDYGPFTQCSLAVDKDKKFDELLKFLKKNGGALERIIIFRNGDAAARKLATRLRDHGRFPCALINRDTNPEQISAWAKDHNERVLVVSDTLGVEVGKLFAYPKNSVVVHFDLPCSPSAYAARVGCSEYEGPRIYSLLLVEPEDRRYQKEISKTLGINLFVLRNHSQLSSAPSEVHASSGVASNVGR